MPSVTRKRVVNAPPEAIWDVIADAYSLPNWWPQVTRVEGVVETGFTEVLYSRRGRPIRVDILYTEVEENTLLAWKLDIPGGQFERLLSEWSTRFTLSPEGVSTRVTIEERQTFRSVSFKTGGIIQRRAARKRVDGALAGLADLF